MALLPRCFLLVPLVGQQLPGETNQASSASLFQQLFTGVLVAVRQAEPTHFQAASLAKELPREMPELSLVKKDHLEASQGTKYSCSSPKRGGLP